MKLQRIVGMTVAMLVCFIGMTGCDFGKKEAVETQTLGETDVFRIEKTICTLPEVKVYLCNYQNIYGNAYGISLWEHEESRDSLETYVKDITMSELTRVVCMEELAKQQELALTKEETASAKEAAKAYYSTLKEAEITYMGVDEEILTDMYADYALAQKLYASLTEAVDKEVSDDEARMVDVMQIFVTEKERADAVQEALKADKDFITVAADYNEADAIELTFGRGDMPAEVEERVFEMEEEQITSCIETAEGYYFIKCVNKFNQELTDERKLEIVKQREQEVFDRVYGEFVNHADSMLNTALWQSVKVESDKNIKTDSFFSTYEAYFEM